MAEYFGLTQNVALNSPIAFEASIPCRKGFVFHDEGTGVFILKGITSNCFARYQVTFNGNIGIPEGGEVTPIAIAITENGEPRQASIAIFTPQAEEEFGNVTSTAIITVPKGCCFTMSVRYVDATVEDVETDPTPTIEVRNANLTITRVA